MIARLRQWARNKVPLGVRVMIRRWPQMLRLAVAPAVQRAVTTKGFAHLAAARSSPLRRVTTLYGAQLQAGKEVNVARAAALLDGVVIPSKGRFSWHAAIGAPVRRRGFLPGPELHGDVLEPGEGGGLCQVANALYWLALHAGMEILERHRHGLDLFPDFDRTAPFGCGATVFYPHRDLRFSNPLPMPVRLSFGVHSDALHAALRTPRAPGFRVEVLERRHRFLREAGQVWRENELHRRFAFNDGTWREELIAAHRARVVWDVPDSLF